MSTEVYNCTSCERQFVGLPSFAAHIKKEHDPSAAEDELEHVRRRALNLPDEDDDDDDDEAEDDLLPTSFPNVKAHVEKLAKRSAALIAERNPRALEAVRVELDQVETHLRLTAEATLRQAERAHKLLCTVEWVLREDTMVVP